MTKKTIAWSYSTNATKNYILSEPTFQDSVVQLDVSFLKLFHKTSHDSVDWTEVFV